MISLSLEVNVAEIISENRSKKPAIRKDRQGQNFAYLYKPIKVKKYQEDMIKQIIPQLNKYDLAAAGFNPKKCKITSQTFYCFNQSFEERDIGNMLKLFEDAVKKPLGIDDSRNFTNVLNKVPLNGEFEKIVIFMNITNSEDE